MLRYAIIGATLLCALAPAASAQVRGVFETRGALTRVDAVALNPQPLPPRETGISNPVDAVALNPQPLPPRFARRLRRGEAQMLSPQPLPPGGAGIPTDPCGPQVCSRGAPN